MTVPEAARKQNRRFVSGLVKPEAIGYTGLEDIFKGICVDTDVLVPICQWLVYKMKVLVLGLPRTGTQCRYPSQLTLPSGASTTLIACGCLHATQQCTNKALVSY